MSVKYYYTLANFDTENPWLTGNPFCEIEQKDGSTILSMIRDININFVDCPNSKIKFSLYRFKGDNFKQFLQKRGELFLSKIFTSENISNMGFEKLNDFEYVVDENCKKQYSNGYEIEFKYDKDEKMFGDKIYLCLPTIRINKN
jgi:hypothetical protein